jgi:hypothetical protein
MQHLKLTKPFSRKEWQSFLSAADPATSFQDYTSAFGGACRFNITAELRQIVDDFGPQSHRARYAIRNGMIESVWIDDYHHYLAIVFSKASGDPEDTVLVQSVGS